MNANRAELSSAGVATGLVPAAVLTAYERFAVLDKVEETALARAEHPADSVDETWAAWHAVNRAQFLRYARRLRDTAHVRACGAVTGSLGLGLRILHCLREAEAVTVEPDGSLHWLLHFPRTRAPRDSLVDEVTDRLRQPVVGRYGQCAVNPVTTRRRAAKVVADLTGDERGVVFLGDSDLVSPLVADAVDVAVHVCEVDTDVLAHLDTVRAGYGLRGLTVHEHDLRRPLPESVRAVASVAVMDPVDSGTGVARWLVRATEALAGEPDEAIYLSINRHRVGGRRLGITRHLADLGFHLEEIGENFHAWPAPNDIADPHIRPLSGALARLGIVPDGLVDLPIYTDLLVYRRLLRPPIIWPQSHVYVRRSI